MSKPTIKMLVPQLRFPEFSEEWVEKRLGEVVDIEMGQSPESHSYNENQIGVPLIQGNADILNRLSAPRRYTSEPTKLCNVGDLLLSVRAPIGEVALSQHDACIGRGVAAIRSRKKAILRFWFQFLLNYEPKWHRLGQGSTFSAISGSDIRNIKVFLPIPVEQQKIADCLSSLDELITAHSKKHEALKAYKKGLMQQLFPAEGETVPKLRFPEFRDAGEWDEKVLAKFSACGLSNGVFNDPKKVGAGYKLINVLDMYIGTVINEEKLNLLELSKGEFLKNKVENGDIFFTRSSLVESGIAYSNIYLGNSSDVTYDGHLIRFRPNKKLLTPMFANYLLRTYRVRSQLVARGKTATMTTIGQTDVGGIKLIAPPHDEQQKIVDCLSSVDDLINAQAQKVESIKAHKKGLMQQLFPATDEVEE